LNLRLPFCSWQFHSYIGISHPINSHMLAFENILELLNNKRVKHKVCLQYNVFDELLRPTIQWDLGWSVRWTNRSWNQSNTSQVKSPLDEPRSHLGVGRKSSSKTLSSMNYLNTASGNVAVQFRHHVFPFRVSTVNGSISGLVLPFSIIDLERLAKVGYRWAPNLHPGQDWWRRKRWWPNQLAILLRETGPTYDWTRPRGGGSESLSKPWWSQHSAGQWSLLVRWAETDIDNSTLPSEYWQAFARYWEKYEDWCPSLGCGPRQEQQEENGQKVRYWKYWNVTKMSIIARVDSWIDIMNTVYCWIIKADIEILQLLLQSKV